MLTDREIKIAKPRDKSYKLFDGGGLYLVVTPAGGKLWRWKYRFGGKEKLLAVGKYPDVGGAAARKRAFEARQILHEGRDPSAEKKAEKERARVAG
ncbi:MAG: Arm DNA-binding domain-containing protein, partial [Burkholderiales bacterium]